MAPTPKKGVLHPNRKPTKIWIESCFFFQKKLQIHYSIQEVPLPPPPPLEVSFAAWAQRDVLLAKALDVPVFSDARDDLAAAARLGSTETPWEQAN